MDEFTVIHSACRTLKGPAIPVPDALRVHMAVGVVLDGVHWHCDVGYGGKGLRLPIRNDLVQTSKDGKFASGLLRRLPFPLGLPLETTVISLEQGQHRRTDCYTCSDPAFAVTKHPGFCFC